MVGRRGRTPSITSPNPQENKNDGQRKKEISEYEQSREERIQKNLERMQKLGILDLSLKLKSVQPTPPRPKKTFSSPKTPVHSSAFPPSAPPRRSSRLQNVTPVSYSEVDLSKKVESLKGMDYFLREEGSKPEVYTEEHEKLLGSTEMSWTLFVDGCGKDGKRIYDPVNGKTCHQCRQKTLGHRTHCSKCGMVQGQFCGDCLYMRYGEHVLEAKQNPNWICPVCRGICNCSLCRQSKGWPPTGPLYRKISSLGYKSVAHYLIQTQCVENGTGTSVYPSSVNRSEPSSHVDSELGDEVGVELDGGKKSDNNLDATKPERQSQSSDNDRVESSIVIETADNPHSPKLSFDKSGALQSETGHEPEDNKDRKSSLWADRHFNWSLAPESSPKPRETRVHPTELAEDSIAGRLKRRCCEDIFPVADDPIGAEDISVHAKVEFGSMSFQDSVETSVGVGQAMVADSGRLKRMGTEENGKERQLLVETKNGTLGFRQKKKPNVLSFPGKVKASDSIAGRLRQRRYRSGIE